MGRRTRRILIAIAVLAAVQAGAFALYRWKRAPPAARPFAVETLTPRDAPELVFERGDGRPGALGELRGQVVMVHFWATWCEPCRDELPGLLALAAELATTGRFELVAVAVDDEWDEIRRFFGEGAIPRAIVRPGMLDIHRRFGASTLPDTYLVNGRGQLVARYAGARHWADPRAREHVVQVIRRDGGSR